MVWPRVDGLRTLELGRPGEQRQRLNDHVLHGSKRATAGLLTVDYEAEGERLEEPGELLALVDDAGAQVGTVRVAEVVVRRLADVPWEFADAEGEGFTSLEHWREAHERYWTGQGCRVDDDTQVVCVHFDLVEAPA